MTNANKLAKDLGFDKADYIGKAGGLSVYMGAIINEDGTPALTGLPLFITEDKEGNLDYEFGFKYMYLVKE